MQKTSPFKFLSAYEKADRAIFFGRDKEIEALYEMAHQSNLTLVYGKSGTGKTSLIQCGLANRFATSDWLDVFVRRKDDINVSLIDALSKLKNAREENSKSALLGRLRERRNSKHKDQDSDSQKGEDTGSVVSVLSSLYTQFFKPVYLIFDQFEELFILGDDEERLQFYETISEIVEKCAYCHIIFVLREESIAQLYDFESVLPTLFDKRLRVEPLSRSNAIEVVESTTAKFEIALENEHIAETIIDAITSGKGQAELTYLQVFLDALYQQSDSDPPVFTNDLVEKLGGIEDVLANFLEVQSKTIQAELVEKYPDVSSRSVRNVLNAFVTLEGTKQPMVLSQVFVPNLSAEQVEYCVKSLEKGRILRYNDDRFELSHDALAARIADLRSTADVAFLEVLKLVRDRSKAFQSTNTYLSSSEISFIRPFQKRVDNEGGLSDEQLEYIRDSIREDKRKRRRRTRQVAVAGSVLTFALIVSVILWIRAEKATYDQLLLAGDNAYQRSDYVSAIDNYEQALEYKKSGIEASENLAKAREQRMVQVEFDSLVNIADNLTLVDLTRTYFENCDSLLEARDLYTTALFLISSDTTSTAHERATNKKRAVDLELNNYFKDLVRRGDRIERLGDDAGYKHALALYTQAIKIQPDDDDVSDKIEFCTKNLEQ